MVNAILRIMALVRKELLAVLKDPRSRFILFAPPVIQCLIYGYAATYDLNDVAYAVLDRDRSAASRELISRLDGSGVFQRVGNLIRTADIKSYIDQRKALLVIQIDQDFERRLLSGSAADVQVIADGRNSNTAGVAMSYVAAVVEAFNASWVSSVPRGDQASVNRFGAARSETPGAPRLTPIVRAWYNPNLETRWHMIPSLIGTLTLLQTLLLTAMSVAREREQGTFDQLLVTPFRPAEIMAGKALPSIIIGVIQATNVLLVAQLWFRIPFAGSFFVLYTGLAVFLLAAVGLGLLVSALVANMQQAMLFSFLIMMPFALMSGFTTPISSMPESLQYLTLINPLRYAIEITQRVYLEGAGLHQLMGDLWPLVAIAVVTLSAASWLFRNRLT